MMIDTKKRGHIANKDIAKAINKTPSSISYVKKTNPEEFDILKLGTLCTSLGLSHQQIVTISALLDDIDSQG